MGTRLFFFTGRRGVLSPALPDPGNGEPLIPAIDI